MLGQGLGCGSDKESGAAGTRGETGRREEGQPQEEKAQWDYTSLYTSGDREESSPFSVGHKPNHSKFYSNALYSMRLKRLQDLNWMDSKAPFQPLQFYDFHL